MTTIEFAKGHGTGNDFVLIPDAEGKRALSSDQIAQLCHRRTGIGGDGLIRVVPTATYLEEAARSQATDEFAFGEAPLRDDPRLAAAEWFMDYYNADGSPSEMCGNGVRVFARYLLENDLALGPDIPVATRAGVKMVRVDGDNLVVDMGAAEFGPSSQVSIDGFAWAGQSVSMGNPHLVCHLGSRREVEELELASTPVVDPAVFPHGTNVEFIAGDGDHIYMRVFERGVGETASCGTGTCAAAAVALRHSGSDTGHCQVDVPGGSLYLTLTEDTIFMSGPAVIVASGMVRF